MFRREIISSHLQIASIPLVRLQHRFFTEIIPTNVVVSSWNIWPYLGFKRQKQCRTEERASYLPSVRQVAATGNLQLICGTNSVRQISCSRLTDSHRLLFLHKEKPILCNFLCSFILRQQSLEIVELSAKILREWSCNLSAQQILSVR